MTPVVLSNCGASGVTFYNLALQNPLFSPMLTNVILCGYRTSNYFIIERKFVDKRGYGAQVALNPHFLIENQYDAIF